MTNRLMISVAASALIAGTGFANAQGTGTGREAPSAFEHAQARLLPSTAMIAIGATHREPISDAVRGKCAQGGKSQRAQDSMKANPKQEKSAPGKQLKGEQSKGISSENDNAKGSKDMKAEGRENSGNMKAEGREDRKMKAEGREVAANESRGPRGRQDEAKAATARRARPLDKPAPGRSFQPNSAPRSPP